MAAVPTWNPGTLYQPGDIVQPITAPPPTAAQVQNGDFTAGNVNWDFTGGAEFSTTGGYTNNGNCVRMPGSVADGLALNKTQLVVPSTGSTFEATAMIQQGASIAGATRGWVEVRWFDVGGVLISTERGNVVSDGSGGAWHQSKLTATRPAGAAYARAGIALFSVADHSHPIWGDNLVVSGTFAGLPDGLVYKAVQPESGFSDADEPAWPPILGQQVIDNEVIWEAVASTRVTWEASPIYVSGPTEPVWPTEIGGFVRDGTIDWKTVSRRVEDANCPDSKIVVIAASKVFAGDDDIVRYSATVNPLDWTTADDAGYLPTGLQNYGANPVAAMGLYRGNLVVFNAEGFQLWQVDEDPASMSLIDALPLGSTEHRSIAPVSNDLFFAASKGVRSIGIAASSTNYQAGDVGMPIDPLIEPLISNPANGLGRPLGLFHPAMGQYWLAIKGYPQDPLSLTGDLPDGIVSDAGTMQYLAEGGVQPYTPIEVVSGQLPPGAVLAADGTVTYTYTQRGNFQWEVAVTDSDGHQVVRPDSAQICEFIWDYTLSVETTPPMTNGNSYAAMAHSPELGITLVGVRTGIYSSNNGDDWVNRYPADESTDGAAWSPDLMLFVATSKAANNSILTSPDGINFTARPVAGFSAVTRGGAATWGAGRFVVAGVNCIAISTNGVNWTVTATTVSNPKSLVYADSMGLFVMAAVQSGTTVLIYTSEDGVTWTQVHSVAGTTAGLCWDAKHRVLYCSTSASSSILKCTNGSTWTTVTLPTGTAGAMAWSPYFGLISMPLAVSSIYATSVDGVTWVQRVRPSSGAVRAIWAKAHQRFTIVIPKGLNGVDNIQSSNSALVCDP